LLSFSFLPQVIKTEAEQKILLRQEEGYSMIRKYTPDDKEKIKHLYRGDSFLEPDFSCYLDEHYKPFVYEEDGEIMGVIVLNQD